MACRVGMSTNPNGRIEYWKKIENCTDGHVVESGLTYEEALNAEKRLADQYGCRQSGGGPKIPGRVWSVYYMSGCS